MRPIVPPLQRAKHWLVHKSGLTDLPTTFKRQASKAISFSASVARPLEKTVAAHPMSSTDGDSTPHSSGHSPAPRVIYACWTGLNPMSPNRRRGLDSLREVNPDIPVVLVSPENLASFILPEHPLHPAYDNLSLVHKSDVLACYLMHFHGGGYGGIKPYRHPWRDAFDRLNETQDAWAIGYREVGPHGIAPIEGALGKSLRRHYRLLIGMGAHIMRPKTPLTSAWYEQLNAVLDAFEPALSAHPGNARGDNPGYPIPWTAVLGQITQSLFLQYHQHLLQDNRLRPVLKDYA